MTKPAAILFLSIFGWIWGPPSASEQAREDYGQGKVKSALSKYQEALEINSTGAQAIQYNIGQCLRVLDSLSGAGEYYTRAQRTTRDEISGMAFNNQGVLQAHNQKLEDALKSFQEALRRHPENEHARFNYELIKHLLQQQQNEPPPPPDTLPPPPQPPRPRPLPQEGGGQQEPMKEIPRDIAEKHLNDLKQKEKSFIQELPKRFQSTPSTGGNDW